MFVVLSVLVALGCVAASLRRLAWAVAPTSLDPATLARALDRPGALSWRKLAEAATSDTAWESDVFRALDEPNPEVRDAQLEEALLELDWRAWRWGRVPRVCASIATSAGFLFGSMALVHAMGTLGGDDEAPSAANLAVSGLNALAAGIAGAAFCLAVHARSRRTAKARVVAAHRFVERARVLADGEHEADMGGGASPT